MKKIFLFSIILLIFCSCSPHIPTYKFTSYTNQRTETKTFILNVNNDKDVEIIVYGQWQKEYNLFHGYERWFPAIAHAKNSIEGGNLSGSWLDSCKNIIVVWKSDDNNYFNAKIDIINGPEEIFRP